MTIIVSLSQPEIEEEYPIIKSHKSEHLIILFTGPDTGTIISSINGVRLGIHSDEWIEENFVKYAGKITMENER